MSSLCLNYYAKCLPLDLHLNEEGLDCVFIKYLKCFKLLSTEIRRFIAWLLGRHNIVYFLKIHFKYSF